MTVRVERRVFNANEMNTHGHPARDIHTTKLDVDMEVRKSELPYWASAVDYPLVAEVKLSKAEVQLLRKAQHLVAVTGVDYPPGIELELLEARLDRHLQGKVTPTGWFFRFANLSPKDSKYSYPVHTGRHIILLLLTSRRAGLALEEGYRTLYFTHYIPDWDPARELRAFVYKGRLTALSQYSLGPTARYFAERSDEYLRGVAIAVAIRVTSVPLPTLSLVIDLYLGKDGQLQVVECNPFGQETPTGSGFFHWIKDGPILYGEDKDVVVRVAL